MKKHSRLTTSSCPWSSRSSEHWYVLHWAEHFHWPGQCIVFCSIGGHHSSFFYRSLTGPAWCCLLRQERSFETRWTSEMASSGLVLLRVQLANMEENMSSSAMFSYHCSIKREIWCCSGYQSNQQMWWRHSFLFCHHDYLVRLGPIWHQSRSLRAETTATFLQTSNCAARSRHLFSVFSSLEIFLNPPRHRLSAGRCDSADNISVLHARWAQCQRRKTPEGGSWRLSNDLKPGANILVVNTGANKQTNKQFYLFKEANYDDIIFVFFSLWFNCSIAFSQKTSAVFSSPSIKCPFLLCPPKCSNNQHNIVMATPTF